MHNLGGKLSISIEDKLCTSHLDEREKEFTTNCSVVFYNLAEIK